MLPVCSQTLHAFFIHALSQVNVDERCCAMELIGYLNVSSVADELLICLSDENIKVARQAMNTLVKLKYRPLVPLLVAKLQQQNLHQADTDEFLLMMIQTLRKFIPLKPEENNQLLTLLNNKSWHKFYLARGDGVAWNELQKQIMLLLATQQCNRLFPILQQLLTDASMELQASIYIAMAKIANQQSDCYLIELLNNAKNKQQILLIRAFAFSANQRTLDALLMLLSRSLTKDISDEIIDVLVTRKASQHLLIVLKNICESQNTSILLPTISCLLKGLVKLMAEQNRVISIDVNLICALLKEDNIVFQQQVMFFLLRYSQISPFYSQLNALNKRLINRCFEIRDDQLLSHACQLLALFADDDNILLLHKLILHKAVSARVKKEAIATLSKLLVQSQNFIQIQQVLVTLSQLCLHPEQLIQTSSLQALLFLSNTSWQSVKEQHPLDSSAAINIILSLLNTQSFTKEQAIRYLCARALANNKQKQHEEMIVNSLLLCLDDDDAQMKIEAAKALSRLVLNNPSTKNKNQLLDKLIGFLDHPALELRCYCFRSLSYLDDPAVLPYLLQKLDDENVQIRCDAIAGLQVLTPKLSNQSQQQIISAVNLCIKDESPRVVVTAIAILFQLNQIDYEAIIELAILYKGQYAEEIAAFLKQKIPQQNLAILLQRVDNLHNSEERITVMKMIATIYCQEESVNLLDHQSKMA